VASPPTQNCITARERFRELIGRIPASELERQSAEELARQCGCSERHFSRLFREHFGHSLVPRKIELRLQKASVLLQETDSKIIDVAMESGFQHVGQFTQHFRKHFGVTPGEWRIRRRKACRN
jgi:transcriptional regulator GlxA family with amidase domain